MIKNPKHFLFGNDIHNDIIHLIHDMNPKETDHLPDIEIHSITLTKYFDKWTYYINYTAYNTSRDRVKSYINFYSSERHQSLDNKIEQYLDNYLTQSTRDKKLKELGIV
jgi:hypothetical protein